MNNHASPRTGRIAASPRARRAMKQRGLSPSQVHGTGPGGRIVEADVVKIHAATTTSPRLSPMRQAIARLTTESFATVPHFYLRAEVDATALMAVRQEITPEVEKQHGVRLTLTDFLLQALALALRDCPCANRIWRDNGLTQLTDVDIGLMVALEDGLLVPVIRQADRRELADLARERARLGAAARSGKLPAEAMGGGATSLSNLGASRVDEFTAIIMPPQSSVLAVGRAAPRPFVADHQLCVRTTLRLCLSVDHRVMDGATAGKYLTRIVEHLEKP